MKPLVILFAAAATLLTAGLSRAQQPADSADGALLHRVDSLENELRQVRRILGTDSSVVVPAQCETCAEAESWHTPVCETCPPGYEPVPNTDWLNESSFPTVKFNGVIQVDSAYFHQSAVNRQTVGDIQDGTDFRRVRLGAFGNVAPNTSYIIEMDFAANQPRFVDVWMNFSDVPGFGNVRIGRWRQPFGMDELTSIKEVAFLERSTPFALGPFRQTGIGFFDHSASERLTWALSGYRYPTDNFGNTTGDNGGWGLAGRVTSLPYYECDGDYLVHLGFAYSFNDPARDTVAFNNVPGVFLGQSLGGLLPAPFDGTPFFTSTGVLPTDTLNLFGLEAAAAVGRVYLQSEFRWTVVRLLNGSTETIPDAYAQARYVLTGEQLPYNKTGGVFGRIVPHEDVDFHGGRGAWEVAARWSYIDMNSMAFPGPGRRMNDVTLGVNWYWNKHTKLQFNYIYALLNDRVLGDSDANIFAARAQLDF